MKPSFLLPESMIICTLNNTVSGIIIQYTHLNIAYIIRFYNSISEKMLIN